MFLSRSLSPARCVWTAVCGKSLSTRATTVTMAATTLSKFRGSLVGAVLGDCLGANFETFWVVKVESVVSFFKRIHEEKDADASKRALQVFTDDTAMARSVAASLIERRGLGVEHMARRFVEEYNKEPDRGYGSNVGNVFRQLEDEDFKDPFGPSKAQFDGSGSYGNGAAMRIAPAALFGYNLDSSQLQHLVQNISLITHSHQEALHGAILECRAVHQALHLPSGPHSVLDTDAFLTPLIELMQQLEKDPSSEDTYSAKLRTIQKFLAAESEVTQIEVEEQLGTDVAAIRSVPAALYSFLRCNKPVSSVQSDNPFERTLIYAVSLGGDTDTIATMACAIAGAYYGMESLPEHWLSICEGVEDAQTYAEQFHGFLEEKQ